ncbi:DUF6228 family protein [Arthrobacter sp. 35W]|uniref:DUF6228 family protein n=1 Tax=Arthrobacter sp. 35W TaxID=1132441 RepID=UPI0012DF4687|nr:DUF6228 family protein [Arthrobacter sp. 35W]
MESVRIGNSGSLIFEHPERSPAGMVESILVTVDLLGLRASRRVVTINGFDDLLRFFNDLSLNWRGWSNTKTYESLEDDLRLTAKHDGHVRFSIELLQASERQGWSLTGELVIDPGEELTNAAQAIESMLTARD